MKLSPAMYDALALIADGEVTYATWPSGDYRQINNGTAGALDDRGLIEVDFDTDLYAKINASRSASRARKLHPVRLTRLGEAFLKGRPS